MVRATLQPIGDLGASKRCMVGSDEQPDTLRWADTVVAQVPGFPRVLTWVTFYIRTAIALYTRLLKIHVCSEPVRIAQYNQMSVLFASSSA